MRRAADSQSVAVGKVHVEQDRIGTDRAGKNQRLGAAAGFPDNLVAPSREKAKGRRAKRWIIVDDQDLYSRLPVDAVIGGHLLRSLNSNALAMGLAPDSHLQVLEHGEHTSVQFGLRAEAELVEDRGDVILDRADGYGKFCRDSCVRSALGHEGQAPRARDV